MNPVRKYYLLIVALAFIIQGKSQINHFWEKFIYNTSISEFLSNKYICCDSCEISILQIRKSHFMSSTLPNELLSQIQLKDSIQIAPSLYKAYPTNNRLLSKKWVNVSCKNVNFLDSIEYNQYFGSTNDPNQNWDLFYEDFPNSYGIILFSPIYIFYEERLAALQISHYCGSLCGEGITYFFKHENHQWILLGNEHNWIS